MSGVRVEPGPLARVVLDRPPLNILDISLLDALATAVKEVAARAETKAILLTGEGRAFCAGVDVADHAERRVRRMIQVFGRAVEAIMRVEQPVIAAVNGAALGGGLELALACDVVLARSGAKLGQPEIQLGVFPPVAAALLPRLVGRQRALDLILTGRVITAEEALDMGLVARVIPPDDFAREVARYTTDLVGLSGPVIRLAKRAVLDGLERPLPDALHSADRLYLEELMGLRDPHEGLAAFVEKREPVWSDG